MSGFIWGKLSKRRMQGVYPYLLECASMTLNDSIYDLWIPWMGGVRTAKEQYNDIFLKGNSKCDGFENLSFHQIEASCTGYGMALDILPVVGDGVDPYKQLRKLNYVGRLMLMNWQELVYKYALEGIDIGVMVWGGTFGATSWDRPHFEIRS